MFGLDDGPGSTEVEVVAIAVECAEAQQHVQSVLSPVYTLIIGEEVYGRARLIKQVFQADRHAVVITEDDIIILSDFIQLSSEHRQFILVIRIAHYGGIDQRCNVTVILHEESRLLNDSGHTLRDVLRAFKLLQFRLQVTHDLIEILLHCSLIISSHTVNLLIC